MSRKQAEAPAQPLRLLDESVFDDFGPDERGTGERGLHLKDLIPRLLARWHWIALGLILGLTVGSYRVWRAVPEYQAQATVRVRDFNPGVLGGLSPADLEDLRSVASLETVRAELSTFELCEAVASDPLVRELPGLIPPAPKAIPFVSGGGQAEAVEAPESPVLASMIQYWLEVSARRNSRLIDVTVTHADPVVARALANKVVSHYMKLSSATRSGDQSEDVDYLIAESARVERELQTAQSLLASYAAPVAAEKALAAAESDVQTLSLRYRHKYPRMIEAQARLKQAQSQLTAFLGRAMRNPVDADYWAAYRDSIENLDDPETIDQVRDLLIARHAVLLSKIESKNALAASLRQKIEQGEINTKQTEAPVVEHEAARLPGRPSSPNKPKILLASLALGLFGGVGLAFLFQFFDNRFHTVSDVESQLGLPVLSAIATLDPRRIAEEELKHKDEANDWLSAREKWSPNLVFRSEGSNSHYAEMFRVLRTAISLLGPSEQRKITMITSALPGEGKTLVAANLAVALAQQGVKTLLVDFDLRKPSVHKMFGLAKDGQPGVVNLLVGNQGAANTVQTLAGQANLSLLLSGPKAPNPGELLEAGRLRTLFEAFRAHFDHIVIDSAPLLAVPDSRILAPLADNLGLVLRAEATPRGAAKRALDILEHSDITPEGIIFNGYTERRSLIGKNYSYGYYRYGKYGYGKSEYGSYGSVYGEEEEED